MRMVEKDLPNPTNLSTVHGMEQTIEIAKRDFKGLCYVKLGELLSLMKEDDLLIITVLDKFN